MTEEKKSSKYQLEFIVPIKSTTTTERGTKGKKEKKIQKNLQNKSKHKNNKFFSPVTATESFPSLEVTVHPTCLECPPTLCLSLDLLWG